MPFIFYFRSDRKIPNSKPINNFYKGDFQTFSCWVFFTFFHSRSVSRATRPSLRWENGWRELLKGRECYEVCFTPRDFSVIHIRDNQHLPKQSQLCYSPKKLSDLRKQNNFFKHSTFHCSHFPFWAANKWGIILSRWVLPLYRVYILRSIYFSKHTESGLGMFNSQNFWPSSRKSHFLVPTKSDPHTFGCMHLNFLSLAGHMGATWHLESSLSVQKCL